MKSKIFIFTTLILVVFLFVITSCDNFLNAKNKTTININLDLSKILKTSRNETTTIPTEYILKVFAYNAATYKPEDEIENLPLLTQTENKVDINGNVKARLDVEIGLNVIFVAKLYQEKSEKPLYAGKSEVIKIKATDNKVHLVLTRENADLDIDILIHDHTFAEDWTSDATHHWHAATCEHTEEISEKAVHNFENWKVTKVPTEEAEGTRESTCTVCGYKTTEVIENLAHTHKFATDWTKDETNHWYASTCGHDVTDSKAEHSFGAYVSNNDATTEADGTKTRACRVCGYKDTVTDDGSKIHVHTFATDWTKDETHHWHAATCEHSDQVSEKAEHKFGNWTTTKEPTEDETGIKEQTCTECGYKATEVIEQLAHTHKFATNWTKDETHHWYAATCEHTTEVSGKAAHTFGEYVSNNDATTEADGTKTKECSACGYGETVVDEGSKIIVPEFVFVKGDTVTGALPAWLDESASDQDKGVFIEGRTVTLSDFYIGKYEVTQEEYASVMQGQKVTVNGKDYALESNPSYCTADSTSYTLFNGDVQEKRPVEGVTWYDSVWYCNALSEKEGLTKAYDIEVTEVLQESGKTGYYINSANVTLNKDATGYRLPTEAEWEYAARGGDPTAADWNYMFSGADTAAGVSYSSTKNAGLDSVGWYSYNSIKGTTEDTYPLSGEQGFGTHQVGKKAPNRLGLYDMSGNVFEWFYDWYGTVITGEESYPTGSSDGSYRVRRGGSWFSDSNQCAVYYRNYDSPNCRYRTLGFRVVRSFIP